MYHYVLLLLLSLRSKQFPKKRLGGVVIFSLSMGCVQKAKYCPRHFLTRPGAPITTGTVPVLRLNISEISILEIFYVFYKRPLKLPGLKMSLCVNKAGFD